MRRTRRVRRSLCRALPPLALLLAAIAIPVDRLAAAATVERTVTISKTTDLVDKEVVTVSWQGFTPGAEVYIHQCLNPTVSWADCAEVSRKTAVSGSDGTGSAEYQVTAGDLLQWNSTGGNPPVRCVATSCTLTVSECGVDVADGVTEITPITIRDGAAPPPIAPDPDTGDVPRADPVVPPVVEPPIVRASPPSVPITLPRIFAGGASGAGHLMTRWQVDAQQPPSSVVVDFISTNSPTGNEQFEKGLVDFAVTADPLTDATAAALRAAGRGYAYAPVAASGLAVVFNMFAHTIRQTKLNLRADHLAQLYGSVGADGTISFPPPGESLNGLLSHPSVRAVNNGCTFDVREELREARPLFRTDRSAANRLFTDYLASRSTLWIGPVSNEFKSSAVFGAGATGTDGLGERIARPKTPGAGEIPSPLPDPSYSVPIGFVDVSQVGLRALTTVGVENAAGAFVKPGPATLAAALDGATVGSDGLAQLPNKNAPAAYPIPVVYYALVPTTTTSTFTPAMGDALRAFLTFAVSDAGQARATELGMTPLPPDLRAATLAVAARLPTVVQSGTPTGTTTPTESTGSTAGDSATGSQAEGAASGEGGGQAEKEPAAAAGAPEAPKAGGGGTPAPAGGTAGTGQRRSARGGSAPPGPAGTEEDGRGGGDGGERPGPLDDILGAPSALLRGAGFVPTLRALLVLGLVGLVAGLVGRRRLQAR